MASGEEDEDAPDMAAAADGDEGDSDSGSASTSGFDGDIAAQAEDRRGAPLLHALVRPRQGPMSPHVGAPLQRRQAAEPSLPSACNPSDWCCSRV